MRNYNKPRWIVQRKIDNRIWCDDGKWRANCDPSRFRLYKQQAAAQRILDRYAPWVKECEHFSTKGKLIAVYEGDSIDLLGRVTRGNI